MQQLPKVTYSPEFRDEAVRLHLENKLPVTEIAKRLSLPRGTLKNWVAAARQGKLGEIGKSQKTKTQARADPAFRSRQPVLRSLLPKNTRPIWHAPFHEPERRLLGYAPMEIFWGSLKNERVHHRKYLTR